jgi:predicted ATPase
MLKSQYLISFEILREKIENEKIYPFNLPIVKNLREVEFHEKVTFFI